MHRSWPGTLSRVGPTAFSRSALLPASQPRPVCTHAVKVLICYICRLQLHVHVSAPRTKKRHTTIDTTKGGKEAEK
jgi:hypothetical protein